MPSQTTRRRTRTFTLVGVTSVAALAAATIGPVGAAAGSVGPVRAGMDLLAACGPGSFDVDGDGVDDIAVGVPGENVGKKKSGRNAGTVTIVYGEDVSSPYGSSGSELITSEDVGQESERNDRFGSSVLVADVNGDDCRDLVIGVPGENKRRGRVMVVFGSMSGLAGHQSLHQDSQGVPGKAERGDGFGTALAVSGAAGGGLWVASPNENLGKISNAGLITQFPFGTGGGKLPLGDSVNVTTETDGVPGSPRANGRFGTVLLGTDAKLYVGVPRQRVGGKGSAGSVYTLNADWNRISQGDGAGGKLERGDRFGASLAVISCPGATGGELAVGSPGEKVGKQVDAGTVTVVTGAGSSVLSQDSLGVPNEVEKGDLFGRSLAGLDGTLAIGVPEENYGGKKNAGIVTQLTLDCSGQPEVVESASVKPRNPNSGDRFGLALTGGILQVGAPVRPMLFVGSPQEAPGGVPDSGSVAVFEDDDSDDLYTKDVSLVTQGFVAGKSEKRDFFGAAVGAAG